MMKEVKAMFIRNLIDNLHDIYRDCEPYDPFNAVTEITKFLFLKLVDDEQGWQRLNMRYVRRSLRQHKGKTLKEIYDELLKDAAATCGVTWLKSFDIKDPTTLVKMTEKVQGIKISDRDRDIIGEAYERLLQVLFRGQIGQFFTPRPVVKFMVELADPIADEETGAIDRVIDPFVGSAGFLIYRLKRIKNDKIREKASEKLLGIDKSPRIAFVGAVNLFLHGGDPRRILEGDSFKYSDVGLIDGKVRFGEWDIVLTNPPFGSRVRSDDILRMFRDRGLDYAESEALALEVMLDLVREGGKIVTIVPESLMKNPKFSRFRQHMRKKAVIKAYISLPLSAFYAYGSTMKTGVLYIVKRGRNVKNGKVFFDCARYVGIDKTGRTINKNDLDAILARFKQFEKGGGYHE